MQVFLRSVGAYVPPRVVSNDEIVARTGGTAQWIEDHTGIRERRFVDPGTTNSDMAFHASVNALAGAGMTAEDVDALVFATLSPDAGFPGSGVFLQRRLGRTGIPAWDVRNQCSGFLYGMSMARALLATQAYRRMLLVGSEIHSTGLDFSPAGRSVATLFGDGAGAAILDTDGQGMEVVDVRLGADGTGAENLWCELPASGLHPNMDASYLAQGRQFPQMQGRSVFRRAVETLERELKLLLADHALVPNDVLLVPHQANKHLNVMVAQRVGIPADQVVSTIERYGNTTAASLPLGLENAWQTGRLTPGRWVALAAFGSGYTWGTALLRVV